MAGLFARGYDMRFCKGSSDGKAKAAANSGVVERGREESAQFCEGKTVRAAGSQEAAAYTWRSYPKGDEAGDQVPFGQKKSSVAIREWTPRCGSGERANLQFTSIRPRLTAERDSAKRCIRRQQADRFNHASA